ncbi:MAG: hypothetical protein OIF47_17655 [Marinibacterium sp.]|nr:hypothetical protein [Marinibacterium sp.]
MKYDILSALSAQALAADKHRQRLALRLMVLITTRYNWRSDELSMGRAEIARLWSVDERTVKRELAKLRSMGWVAVKRAGVRGRVTVYEIDFKQILIDTRPGWERIGPDFIERIDAHQGITPPLTDDPKVVPLPRPAIPRGEGASGDLWDQVLAALGARDPATAQAWYAQLISAGLDGDTAVLLAPSGFVASYVTTHFSARLLSTFNRFDRAIRAVRIDVAQAPD